MPSARKDQNVRRERPGHMIRRLIFDMGGTLADAVYATTPALSEVSPRYGLPLPVIETVRQAIGYATPSFITSYTPAATMRASAPWAARLTPRAYMHPAAGRGDAVPRRAEDV